MLTLSFNFSDKTTMVKPFPTDPACLTWADKQKNRSSNRMPSIMFFFYKLHKSWQAAHPREKPPIMHLNIVVSSC